MSLFESELRARLHVEELAREAEAARLAADARHAEAAGPRLLVRLPARRWAATAALRRRLRWWPPGLAGTRSLVARLTRA